MALMELIFKGPSKRAVSPGLLSGSWMDPLHGLADVHGG